MPAGSNDTTRTRRTPAQIAQEALDAATERVTKAEKRVEAAKAEVQKAEADVKRATALREYAAANPDLPGHDDGDVTAQLTRNDGVIDGPVGEATDDHDSTGRA